MIWVLESEVFPKSHAELRKAIAASGHQIIDWHDEWWSTEWPRLGDSAVVFHGSFGNAARIQSTISWQPGAYCDVSRFHCTAWYPHAREWLLNRDWRVLRLCDLVDNPNQVLAELGQLDSVFIRPDSPLNPFSGADLYACQAQDVVAAVSDVASKSGAGNE